jgi:sugar phosphate isomerase/epimerase
VSHGHGPEFWVPFLGALNEISYDDVVSIENEDPVQNAVEGVTDAAQFITPFLR